ncbi:MAG: hypothetical protein U9N80_14680 [Chloroflexota bacterium]|nr:hypothetical protein [Chloroflexota bacterium]
MDGKGSVIKKCHFEPFDFSFDRLRTGLRINSARNPCDESLESSTLMHNELNAKNLPQVLNLREVR